MKTRNGFPYDRADADFSGFFCVYAAIGLQIRTLMEVERSFHTLWTPNGHKHICVYAGETSYFYLDEIVGQNLTSYDGMSGFDNCGGQKCRR